MADDQSPIAEALAAKRVNPEAVLDHIEAGVNTGESKTTHPPGSSSGPSSTPTTRG